MALALTACVTVIAVKSNLVFLQELRYLHAKFHLNQCSILAMKMLQIDTNKLVDR